MIELKKDGYYMNGEKTVPMHFECKEHSGKHKIDVIVDGGIMKTIVRGTADSDICSDCIGFVESIELKEE